LTSEQKSDLQANIQLLRDAIVLFTASGAARGVSGHTGEHFYYVSGARYLTDIVCNLGGAYDTVPELCILLSLFNHSDKFFPIVFDEAGKSKVI
jgi:hypothetical protein